ncbi:MAG TPA: glycosyltransferase family 61 protein [Burkholderiales bacterium]|nr:glycosyltransferase family 61 protein [Burkholderiales bacterium]
MLLGRLLKRRSSKRVRDVPARDYVERRGTPGALRSLRIAATRTQAQLLDLESGWLYTPLCVPIGAERCTTLDLHRVYSRDKYDVVYTDAFAEALDACAVPSVENIFVLSAPRNYWHFIMDCVPRLCFAAVMPDLRERALLVDAGATATEREVIARAAAQVGMEALRLVPAAHPLQPIAQAACPGYIDRYSATALWDEMLYPAAARPRRGIERLFVRRAARMRRLVNEDALVEALARIGFTAVDPGALGFEEQVATFADARVIVGVHGAALTNVLFAPRGATFVELYTTVHQPFYAELAAAKGMRYVPLAGESHEAAVDQHDDFGVDVPRVLEVLKELGVS